MANEAKPTDPERKVVKLELSREQVKVLSQHAKSLSYGLLTVQIISEGQILGELKTASYSYHGDTCCV